MAGHRSRSEGPPQHEVRQRRRRTRMARRMATAATPSQRIAAVADHLRAALPYLPPATAEAIAAQAIARLQEAIEQAYREEARAARTRQTW